MTKPYSINNTERKIAQEWCQLISCLVKSKALKEGGETPQKNETAVVIKIRNIIRITIYLKRTNIKKKDSKQG